MSNLTFEYLKESVLFHRNSLERDFAQLTDRELLSEVGKYREFCMNNADNLEAELSLNPSKLKVFSGSDAPSLELLKQCGLYIEQFVICDPLFPFSAERDVGDNPFNSLFGTNTTNTLDRNKLIGKIRYLIELRPMIEAGYVGVFPTTRFFERPKEIPFRYSETGFSEDFPRELLKFFHENSVVASVKDVDGKMMIDGSLERGRKIFIRFREHGAYDASAYVLAEQKIISVDKESRTAKTVNYVPSEQPDEEKFTHWVNQSINQTAGHLYRRVLTENQLAAYFGASYICKTPFLFNLLQQSSPVDDSVQSRTINAFLNFDLPFLETVDAGILMKMRLNDGEAFHNFRQELEKHFRELQLIGDPDVLKMKVENAFHEINEVQVNRIEEKMRAVHKQVWNRAALATAGFIGAIQSAGSFSLVALATAIFNGYKAYTEYQSVKQENPAFFLWKTRQISNKAKEQGSSKFGVVS